MSDWPTAPQAGNTAADTAGITMPQGHRANAADQFTALNATRDVDRDDELPDVGLYEGPQVADEPASVNPSAGMQGPAESGPTDITPPGPTVDPSVASSVGGA